MIVQDPSNATECNLVCSKFATANKIQGCCSSFTGSSPTCKFYIDVVGGLRVNNAPLRKATTCLAPSLTTTTSSTVTTASTSSTNLQYACSDFIAKNHCDSSMPISLLDCKSVDCSDTDLCKSACEAKANELDESGCCYTFQGTLKVCNYYPGSTSISNKGTLRFVSICNLQTTANGTVITTAP